MEDITQKLQQLTKSRRIAKLIYKQSNERRANLFVNDFSV
jgi:dsRNA-specific ribonuclease